MLPFPKTLTTSSFGGKSRLEDNDRLNQKHSFKCKLVLTKWTYVYCHCSDEPEPEFSSSSEPELWSFRAEPSRAGALQFPSWNRADNTDNMYIK